jgi:hypothetical protein
MSDRSIASIARSLAAALLAEKPIAAKTKRNTHVEEDARVAALEEELCEEYRAEIVETLRV